MLKKISFAAVILVLGSSFASAKWGHGLGREYKTIYIPLGQQSGWGVQVEGQSSTKPVAKAETPRQVAQKPVDSDNDGVVDSDDNCPSTAAGVKVDAKGCPQGAKAVPQDNWVLSGVQFEIGSDVLKRESESSLNEAAEILNTHAKVRVEIQGHTDNTGKADFNQSLSERRANSVKSYLVTKGVAGNRLETKGYGQNQPKADNSTADGRAQNRRIEFKVLSR